MDILKYFSDGLSDILILLSVYSKAYKRENERGRSFKRKIRPPAVYLVFYANYARERIARKAPALVGERYRDVSPRARLKQD